MKNNRGQKGFTLIELLVVLGIIALALAIVLPSILNVFSAGADAQARAMINATLGAARSAALENQTFTVAHFQIGTDGRCWLAIFRQDADLKTRLIKGWPPQPLPGQIAMGQLSSPFTVWGHFATDIDSDAKVYDFTCVNVIFGPDGRVDVGNFKPDFDKTAAVFTSSDPNVRIWDTATAETNEVGVRAMAVLDYPRFRNMNASDRNLWLEQKAQALGVNLYTGEMIAGQ